MKLTWVYLAGFFDGEGSISLRHNGKSFSCGHYPVATISQSRSRGLMLLQDIKAFLSEFSIYASIHKNGKPIEPLRQAWALCISRRQDVITFAEYLLPHSVIKRTELQDMLRTLKLYPKRKQNKGDSN